MNKSIPHRWLEYKPFGTVIKGTKILPFKVPLKETISTYLKPEDRFTTSALMRAFPRLKYIIDLTNTNRYYDPQVFIDSGITYRKIWVIGHEVPSSTVVEKSMISEDSPEKRRDNAHIFHEHAGNSPRLSGTVRPARTKDERDNWLHYARHGSESTVKFDTLNCLR